MKPFVCVALVAGAALAPLLSAGPSSAEYQAAIREATDRYRGDFTESTSVVTQSFEYYEIDPLHERSAVPDLLSPNAFAAIALSLEEDPAMAPSPAPNQTLQLTTTAPRPGRLFDDLFPPTTIDTSYQ